jgi:hypothetical protein
MCCLKYEEFAYEDLVKKAPKSDAFVETPSGKGSVISVNLLRGSAKVRLEEGLDTTLKTFTFDELDVLGGKGRRAEYIAAKAEGKLEEAGFTVSPAREFKRTSEPSRQSTREGHSPGNVPPQKQGTRHERKATPDPKKKQGAPGPERPAKEGEENAKQPRPQQPADGAQPKKLYTKRRKGGRGKNK